MVALFHAASVGGALVDRGRLQVIRERGELRVEKALRVGERLPVVGKILVRGDGVDELDVIRQQAGIVRQRR